MSVHQVLKRGAFIFAVVIFLHYNNIQSTELLGKYQALSDYSGGKSWPIGIAIRHDFPAWEMPSFQLRS